MSEDAFERIVRGVALVLFVSLMAITIYCGVLP